MLFELMQIETEWSKNYFIFSCNVQFELWKGTLTWNKKNHPQNQQKIIRDIFRDIWSVNNPIQTATIETCHDFVLKTF